MRLLATLTLLTSALASTIFTSRYPDVCLTVLSYDGKDTLVV
jgi:hypothetical protein